MPACTVLESANMRFDLNSNLYAACRNFLIPTSIWVSEGARSINFLCVLTSSTAFATCIPSCKTEPHAWSSMEHCTSTASYGCCLICTALKDISAKCYELWIAICPLNRTYIEGKTISDWKKGSCSVDFCQMFLLSKTFSALPLIWSKTSNASTQSSVMCCTRRLSKSVVIRAEWLIHFNPIGLAWAVALHTACCQWPLIDWLTDWLTVLMRRPLRAHVSLRLIWQKSHCHGNSRRQ